MRSKMLLLSNIISSIFVGYLLWIIGGAAVAIYGVVEVGGMDYLTAITTYFQVIFDLIEIALPEVYNYVWLFTVAMCIQMITFVLGNVIGWISYVRRKSGGAKAAARLYLLGTICFPLYIFVCLPITIMSFIGAKNQKKINNINAG